MSAEPGKLDPEVRAVLEEVAADPRSHLLRVPRLRVPLEHEPPVSPGEAGLTAAERHLLQAHRAEVARLLLLAVVRAVYDHPSAASQLHRCVTVDRELELPDPDEWRQTCCYQLEASPPEVRAAEGYSLLERCARKDVRDVPAPIALALASMRLVPRVETQIYLALALHQAKQTRSGLNVLQNVIARRPSQLNSSYAWESIGFFEWELGRQGAALSAYREASSSQELRNMPVMSWMVEPGIPP